MRKSLVWVRSDGAELSDVEMDRDRLSATGVMLGGGPLPFRLDYELTTGDDYITTRLLVRAEGTDPAGSAWRRSLELLRDPAAGWSVQARAEGGVALPPPGGDAAGLAGALDCDLALCPLADSMPVLRHGLHRRAESEAGAPVEFLMAWVSVPGLAVSPSWQTYEFLRHRDGEPVIHFSTSSGGADVVFDHDGFVVDYPGLGKRA